MPKSSYPNKIDSSVELPIVRNNVTEINAEVINSLRDAIIQIEKTLGINPHGVSSVSDRMSSSLDLSGEIRREALDKAGVLYGPVTNESVSRLAGIEESKLRLDFPTRLIQSEVSLLKAELESFILIIEEVSAKLSSHLNVLASSRHTSDNIHVNSIATAGANTATNGFDGGPLSDVLSDIYNGHIGFSGTVAQDNKSHSASQIYFDNANVTDVIVSTNLQGAVEDLADSKAESLKTSLFSTSSNGVVRQSKYFDVVNNIDGKLKLDYTYVSYSAGSLQSQVIYITTPVAPLYDISKFDMVELTSGENEEDDKKYIILDFEIISGLLYSVTILGGTKNNSAAASRIRILKNPYQYSNLNAYNTTVRPRYNRTNTPDIIISNPNAATIITKNISAEKINSFYAFIGLEVDSVKYNVPIYNSLRGSTNTLDEIILNINEYFSDNKIPVFAYKYRDVSCYEIALSHIIPSWIDSTVNRYLKIVTADSADASSQFGVSDILDEEIYGNYGNSILINGNKIDDNSSILTYLGSDLELEISTNNILFNVLNPISEGIKVGNLCYIEDNGLYRIKEVNDSSITLDDQGSLFSVDIADEKRVFIYKSTVSLEEFEFSEIVGTNGSIMLDIFMTESLEYGVHMRASIEGDLKTGSFNGILFDISKGYLIDESIKVSIDIAGSITTFDGLLTSDSVQLYSDGEYIIKSPGGSNFLKMKAIGEPPLSSNISVMVNGFSELPYNLIHLSRCLYSTSFGFVIGESNIGVPSVTDKRPSGTLNEVNISPSIIEKYISGPRSELRSDGVASGLEFSLSNIDSTSCLLTVGSGFYYNSGARYKFNGIENLPITHDGSNFYIVFDREGCLRVGSEILDPIGSGYISPFYGDRVVYLSYMIIESASSIKEIDLRKNISFIDKKINQIIVASESGAGHFTSVKKAVDYARYYKKFNVSESIPSILIKNGVYEIDETIILDFDIQISGSGPLTILKHSDTLLSTGTNEEILLNDYNSAMFLIGSDDTSTANQSSDLFYGVKIENLTCKYSDLFSTMSSSNFNSYFLITQGLATADDILSFKFNNIIFEGSSSMSESKSQTTPLDGERQIIPILIGVASDLIALPPSDFGSISVSNCTFRYMGSGWATLGAVISKAGTYNIRDCNIYGNTIKKASPNANAITSGDYIIFNISTNYTMSGYTFGSPVFLTLLNTSVVSNVLSE